MNIIRILALKFIQKMKFLKIESLLNIKMKMNIIN
jgi:hypothetical protein